jgi:hypothetical protein
MAKLSARSTITGAGLAAGDKWPVRDVSEVAASQGKEITKTEMEAGLVPALAATATKLATARTIGGTAFDGTTNITPANATNAVNATNATNAAVAALADDATPDGALDDRITALEVHTHEEIMGFETPEVIAPLPAAGEDLNWVSNGSGDELFNLTAPKAPVVITPGIYAVSALVRPSTLMAEGSQFEATLHMDPGGEDAIAKATSALATADFPQPSVTVSLTFYMPASATMRIGLVHNDPTTDAAFIIEEVGVQRIS